MYEAFFGFARRPFSSAPRLEDYFPSAAMEHARHMLSECLERGAGWGLVTGAAGLGKTLLCQRLAQDLQKDFQVVLLSGGGIPRRRDLWQTLLYALGQPYRGMEEGELRLALVEYLAAQQKQTPGFLLLVDEAHCLPGKLLEEIRILSNLPTLDSAWFRVMLAGTGILEERLSCPRLEAFHQRIVAQCYLEPWSRTETLTYIQTQFQKVCSLPEFPIGEEAAVAVFHATAGIPRLVNQLCDHALLWACSRGVRVLKARDIEETWAELQQLPPPSPEKPASEHSVVEFSVLSEEEDFPQGFSSRSSSWRDGASEGMPSSAESAGLDSSQRNDSPSERPASDSFGYQESPSSSQGTSFGDASSPQTSEIPPSLEEAESSFFGPEQEIFFGHFAETSSEASSSAGLPETGPVSEQSGTGPTSAWQQLETIERALSKMTDTCDADESDMGHADESRSTPDVEAPSPRAQEAGTCAGEEVSSVEAAASRWDAESGEEPTFSSAEEWSPADRKKEMQNAFSSMGSPTVCGIPVCSPAGIAAQPAMSLGNHSGPEVEMVFGSHLLQASCSEALRMENDPFAETFLEEEWIEDPYLCLGMEGQRPWSVISLLQRRERQTEGRVSDVAPNEGGGESFRPVQKSASESSSLLSTESRAPSPAAILPLGPCNTPNLSKTFGGVLGEEKPTAPNEPPLIVIEENLEEPASPPKSSVIPVARHEYRRLFARLRRA